MRICEQWLRAWTDPGVDTTTLAERLTMAGLEVDAVEVAAPAFHGVVVARVDAVETHPEAPGLSVCRVDDGSGPARAVVCGAPNARTGLHVPYARDGAVLPGGRAITTSAIRGVESVGMLCSAQELGLAETSTGLHELPPDAPVGADFRDWAGLDDAVLELELTPNRGDCLSLRGVAREVGVAFASAVTAPACTPCAAAHEDVVPIDLVAPEACPRYAGRVVHGIDPAAETPYWLAERLRRSGVRSVNAVVDVTNYVMLELGQPMHAFDLERLSGRIRARWSAAGERLTLLDGRTVDLDADTLVIADDDGPVALAGVMGGAHSAVGAGSTSVFLESACFSPHALAGRARAYGAHSESSHRFERGVDPALPPVALERATELLLAICGGEAGPASDVVEASQLPQRPAIPLRRTRVERLLGYNPGDERVRGILDALGLRVTETDEGWSAEPPSWRYDLAIEADLIEEIARIHGYDRTPRTAPAYAAHIEPTPERRRPVEELRQALVERDYHEAITYSFVDSRLQRELDPEQAALALTNPISADMDVMRTNLWPGLIQALRHNANRQQERVRLFEVGLRFRPQADGSVAQEGALGLLAAGPAQRESWALERRAVDFYDVKGDIEALLAPTAAARPLRFEPARHPGLHPGQSARIYLGDDAIGWLGALDPRRQKALDLDSGAILAEFRLEPLLHRALPSYRPIPRHPSIRRDLAVIVDEKVTAESVRAAALAAGPDELESVFIFDVYRGKSVETGRKSFALGLILQGFDRTLTDREVEAAVDVVLRRLGDELGATLRE